MGITKCCKKKRITAITIENTSKNSENLIPNDISLSERPLETINNKENENQNPNATLEDFSQLKVLGRGSFGKVVLVRLEKTKKLYAMKILKKELVIKRKQVNHTMTERSLLEKLNHTFIVKLFYAFQDKTKLYFITEFMQGGELFFHLRRNSQYKEKSVKFYMSEILLAIDYMHKNNFIYRDLKPENILIDQFGHIKLTDFGLSKLLDEEEQKTYTLCGTPEYLAPEILSNKGYDNSVDFFSLGCLIYEMLSGKSPFKIPNNGIIKMENYLKIPDMPDYFSESEKDIITKLLNSKPKLRLGYGENGIQNIKNHSYFNNVNWNDYRKKKVNPPFIPIIKNDFDLTNFDKQFTLEDVFEDDDNENEIEVKIPDDEYENFTYENREFREKLEKNEEY